jgi:hypothetical protein
VTEIPCTSRTVFLWAWADDCRDGETPVQAQSVDEVVADVADRYDRGDFDDPERGIRAAMPDTIEVVCFAIDEVYRAWGGFSEFDVREVRRVTVKT